jgi:hypothetical protein
MCLLLIRYRSGTIQRGVLLAIEGNELRVAAEGCDDILLFRWLPEGWVSEDSEMVTFEFPTAAFEALEMDLTSEKMNEQSRRQKWVAGRRHAVVN